MLKSYLEELAAFRDLALVQPRRSMAQFAEDEIILPNDGGPFSGMPFRLPRQPFTILYFQAVESGVWNCFISTGPSQSGKTLICSIIPVLFHLFECKENVLYGLPDMDMATDKWVIDFLPVIRASAFAHLLPDTGSGSRGGKTSLIQFKNGVFLKFISGGGSDKSRAGYTGRVLGVTEIEGMGKSSLQSNEADKFEQMLARLKATKAKHQRIYAECTLTTKEGLTWQKYEAGTASRIVCPCVHCGDLVDVMREHLLGWEEAEDELQARAEASFFCPACGQAISDSDRIEMNRRCQLLHGGQSIVKGKIIGEPKPTLTLGFCWSAFNNLFRDTADIAAEEWKGKRALDEDNAERKLCQFDWGIPYETELIDGMNLNEESLKRRQSEFIRGQLPPDTQILTVGGDVHKRLGYFVVIAFRKNQERCIVDYGKFGVDADRMAEDRAILTAWLDFKDELDAQFPEKLDEFWIDGGYMPAPVHKFCIQSGANFRPTHGYGNTQMIGDRRRMYSEPKKKKGVHLGEEFHIAERTSPSRAHLVNVNADYWKEQVHKGFTCPPDSPGAIKLYKAPSFGHMGFAKQVTAEKRKKEFVQGKGEVVVWEKFRRDNHWLDCMGLALAAGSFRGFSILPKPKPKPKPKRMPSKSKGRGIRTKY